MAKKKDKKVLFIGGNGNLCLSMQGYLDGYSVLSASCQYFFTVEYCRNAGDAPGMIRAEHYDVVVIYTWPEAERAAFFLCHCLNEQFGPERPIKIVVDNKPHYDHCIQAMRLSVYDYILKEEAALDHIGQKIACSIVKGLTWLDRREELEEKIAGKWLGENWHWIKKDYGGRLVAIRSGEEGIAILASGQDAFELEQYLFYWREENPDKELFIIRIPNKGFSV